eukprot:2373049-Pleurochrysis_carterae.AAC.1
MAKRQYSFSRLVLTRGSANLLGQTCMVLQVALSSPYSRLTSVQVHQLAKRGCVSSPRVPRSSPRAVISLALTHASLWRAFPTESEWLYIFEDDVLVRCEGKHSLAHTLDDEHTPPFKFSHPLAMGSRTQAATLRLPVTSRSHFSYLVRGQRWLIGLVVDRAASILISFGGSNGSNY